MSGAAVLKTLLLAAYYILLGRIGWKDWRTRKIPDRPVLLLAALGAAAAPLMPEISLLSRLTGVFLGSVPLFLCAVILPGSFGGGDIKLMAAAGFFLGWKAAFAALLFAIAGAGAYSAVCLAAKKKGRKEQFAFGPFLCMGIAAAYFWGEMLWERLF